MLYSNSAEYIGGEQTAKSKEDKKTTIVVGHTIRLRAV